MSDSGAISIPGFLLCIDLGSDLVNIAMIPSFLLLAVLHDFPTELQPGLVFSKPGNNVLRQFDVEIRRRSEVPDEKNVKRLPKRDRDESSTEHLYFSTYHAEEGFRTSLTVNQLLFEGFWRQNIRLRMQRPLGTHHGTIACKWAFNGQ